MEESIVNRAFLPDTLKANLRAKFLIRIKANLNGISLKDFFEKLEGPLGVMDCYFDSECQITGCNVKAPIEKINDNIRKMLSTMTLKEVTQ